MLTIDVVKRSRPNRKGLHPLQLKLTLNRRTSRLNIGENIDSQYWDDETQTLRKSHPDYRVLQTTIINEISKANKTALLLESEMPDYTLDMLKTRLSGNRKYKQTFFSQGDDFFETMRFAGKINRVQGEKPALNHFRRFAKGKDLAFEDVSFNYLSKFIAYLEGLGTVSQYTIMNYLKTLRTIYNLGIKNGHVKKEHYPFGHGNNKIKIHTPESLKIGLDQEEIQRLENLDLPPLSYLDHTRKCWLFSFYFAGMRTSDLLMLKWSSLVGGRLHYTMGKNNKPVSVVVPPKAQAILDFYKNLRCEKTNLVFPDMRDVSNLKEKRIYQPLIKNRNKKLNKHLRILAKMAEIEKPLTMHIARHSFGNIAGDKIPLLTLQKLYRHSSITTTVNYQRAFMNKSSDEALLSVTNFSNSKDSYHCYQ